MHGHILHLQVEFHASPIQSSLAFNTFWGYPVIGELPGATSPRRSNCTGWGLCSEPTVFSHLCFHQHLRMHLHLCIPGVCQRRLYHGDAEPAEAVRLCVSVISPSFVFIYISGCTFILASPDFGKGGCTTETPRAQRDCRSVCLRTIIPEGLLDIRGFFLLVTHHLSLSAGSGCGSPRCISALPLPLFSSTSPDAPASLILSSMVFRGGGDTGSHGERVEELFCKAAGAPPPRYIGYTIWPNESRGAATTRFLCRGLFSPAIGFRKVDLINLDWKNRSWEERFLTPFFPRDVRDAESNPD